MPTQYLTPALVHRMPTPGLRPVCERLLTALERVRGEPDSARLATRAALRQAVMAYIQALRSEGIAPAWVLQSVVAFARGVRPGRAVPQTADPVEEDVLRWSLAALRWPTARPVSDVEVLTP
jgi:hypothetical protein